MKKSLALSVGVAILAGAWLGTTWYTGKQLEAESATRIAQANQQLAQAAPELGLTITQVSFDRGFFTSKARYALSSAADTEEDLPSLKFEFDNHYEHGPFPASAIKNGQLMPKLAVVHSELVKNEDTETWFEASEGSMPLSSEIVLSYNGDATYDIRFAAVKLDEDGDKFSFSGADLNGTFLSKNQHATGKFNAPALSMDVDTEENGRVVINVVDSQMDFDTWLNSFGIQTGNAELRVAKVAINQDENNAITIDQFAYGARSSEDEKFMNSEVYLSAGALALNSRALGSQKLTFKMNKMDGQALKRLSDTYNDILAQPSTEDEGFSEAQISRLVKEAQDLLAGNPTLSVDNFEWTTDKGRSTLAIHSDLTAPTDLNLPASLMLAQMVKNLRLDLNLNKPMVIDLTTKLLQEYQGMDEAQAQEVAVQQVEELAATMAMMGLGEDGEEVVKSQVVYDGSKITVNGRELPPESLLGLMMLM